jgi:uncharacterized protein (TIGR02145 family)
MKHILRNTLLLLWAAVFSLAACNKAELEGLRSEVDSLNSTVDSLKARIDAANVTLSCIPDYDDGSVGVQYTHEGLKISGSATLNFTVQPASAAETIAKDWESSLSVLSFYTLTKADGGDAAQMSVSGASVNEDGKLAITVESDKLCKDFILGNLGATLAIKVSCGDIKTVSPYIKLVPVMEEESFITYLLNTYDADGDGQFDNMDTATKLNVSGYGLTSIDDILAQMPALTALDCSGNKLTSLDLSKNPALTTLDCRNNNLTSIDLSKNEKLTTMNLTGNANLTKVVGKSSDWFDACSISADGSALFYLPDGTQIQIIGVYASTIIDGKAWMNYNVGASESNLYGSRYTFYNAQTACPTGWRAPTKDELTSLSAHHSAWTTYLGVNGFWVSGSQAYSSNVSAIFLPVLSSSSLNGGYWSSTGVSNSDAYYYLYFGSGYMRVYNTMVLSYEWSVRCVKD